MFLYGAEILMSNKVHQHELDVLNDEKSDCIISL